MYPIDSRLPQKYWEKEIKGLTAWLIHRVKEANAQGLILGVSGGVDSAVVAGLVKIAFSDASLGLILPCDSSPEEVRDAHLVCDTVGIRKLVIDLADPRHYLLERVQKGLAELSPGMEQVPVGRLTDANLRARLRMCTLYAVANALNYLVVGTDNAAEVYTGYFTKYGDGGVDLLPLARYVKREVRELAQELGIPASIIQKAPSAGLWSGQTDEAELGVTYEEIDAYLEGKSVREKTRDRIEFLHRSSEHKRKVPPVYPREDGKELS